MSGKSLKGTWPQAIWAFFWPILLILSVRWAFVEPYVIPSGSMIPNLLVHDHIFVQKFSYGIRFPLSQKWLLRWGEPRRGDTVVFRYPQAPSIFYIKRLIGRPGDRVKVTQGRIEINGRELKLLPHEMPKGIPEEERGGYAYFVESGEGLGEHPVRFRSDLMGSRTDGPREWTVPEGQYFFMGDNRDESNDGRSWGFVPEANLIGKAWVIWLSCDQMLKSAPFLCDPSTLRWQRLFTREGL